MTLKDTSFVDLMLNRVYNVLLIANPYDAFMLEDDGRVDEKIFSEYAKLGLRFPPRFLQVHSKEEAVETMAGGQVNLVIVMPAAEDNSVFDIARSIKRLRVRLLLARQHRTAALHHQTYGGPHEPGARYTIGWRADAIGR